MNAQELVALAATRGIDLGQVAGNSSNTEGKARKRKRTPMERRLGLRILDTADGSDSRMRRAPYWSHAELGVAACGLPRMPFLALQYSIAGHCDDFGELHRGLMLKELKIAEHEHWPSQIQKFDGTRGWYTAELAGLVLDADWHKPIFTDTPGLYAIYVGVSQEIWHAKMLPLYRSLANEHMRWVATGLSWVRRRIVGPDHREAVA